MYSHKKLFIIFPFLRLQQWRLIKSRGLQNGHTNKGPTTTDDTWLWFSKPLNSINMFNSQTCTKEDLSDEKTTVDTYLTYVCLCYPCIYKDPLCYLRFWNFVATCVCISKLATRCYEHWYSAMPFWLQTF